MPRFSLNGIQMTRSRQLQLLSLLTAWVALACVAGCGKTVTTLHTGENGYLEGKGGNPVLVSGSAKTHEQLEIFLGAGREPSVRALIAQGKVIACETGTRVTVVEPGPKASTVRITAGSHSGKTGIVANEFLRRY